MKNVILYKRESSFGTDVPGQAGERSAGLVLPTSKMIKGKRVLVGDVSARIECPCCKTGILIELHIDQELTDGS